VSFPAAEGVRLTWADLPDSVQARITDRLGAPVVEAVSHAAGFSPGVASRLRTEDGRNVFVKAVSGVLTPHSVAIHRREARVAAALPRALACPRLRWSFDDGEWVVLAFDFVPGHTPPLPWRARDLDRVLRAMVDLGDALTPSPIEVESAVEILGESLQQWHVLAEQPAELAQLDPAWRAHIDELVELEARWSAVVSGDTLLHLDVRADNVLLTGDGVCFTDWPWAATGARWFDVLAFLPSVAMQGGPDPDDVWERHPYRKDADDDAIDAVLAGFAGYLTRMALLPAPPGLPTLRAFQAGQGVAARAWLARRRRWRDVPA
jgi:Ser/Thr protein kinase RdoA (MazF antagonist)